MSGFVSLMPSLMCSVKSLLYRLNESSPSGKNHYRDKSWVEFGRLGRDLREVE